MAHERTAPVLLAVSEVAERGVLAHALGQEGYEVWQASDYDEAVTLLHASPRRLVVLVSPDQAPVLRFATSDRRLVHHHVYITLERATGEPEGALSHLFPYLTVLPVTSPTRDNLTQTVSLAMRMLRRELNTPQTYGERQPASRMG